MFTVAFARFAAVTRSLIALTLLIAAQSVTPSLAAEPVSTGQWFLVLLKTANQKSFCIPAATRVVDIAQAVAQDRRSRQITSPLTPPEATGILARLYPCRAASTVANAEVPKPDGGPVGLKTIDVMRALQKTAGHENDSLLEQIRKHSDAYPPPVLIGLARVLYQQGNVDDAIFWFNAGRLRGNFDAWRSADVVNGRATMVALSRQLPIALRKAQFADLPKLREIVAKVIAWDETTPRNYDRQWIDFHGVSANRSGPSVAPATIPPEKWDDLARQVRAEYRKDLEKSIALMSNARLAAPQR
jgi:hypothetical protein